MAIFRNTSSKKCILWARDSKSMFCFFLISYYIIFEFRIFFFFSFLSQYLIIVIIMSCIYFERILNDFVSKKEKAPNIFFSGPRLYDRELVVVLVYYFQIRNKKEYNIIISRVTSSHMGPVYIETLYIYIYIYIYI